MPRAKDPCLANNKGEHKNHGVCKSGDYAKYAPLKDYSPPKEYCSKEFPATVTVTARPREYYKRNAGYPKTTTTCPPAKPTKCHKKPKECLLSSVKSGPKKTAKTVCSCYVPQKTVPKTVRPSKYTTTRTTIVKYTTTKVYTTPSASTTESTTASVSLPDSPSTLMYSIYHAVYHAIHHTVYHAVYHAFHNHHAIYNPQHHAIDNVLLMRLCVMLTFQRPSTTPSTASPQTSSYSFVLR
ncbi:hypothetical protein Slin14017_G088000 [Septoria linicola]|nr:hypothetical protein Slin14017_G088000 [Septoria linicola]